MGSRVPITLCKWLCRSATCSPWRCAVAAARPAPARRAARVRWVHAIELTDVARLLRGGELVLSTGIALPDDDRLLAAYVTELAEGGGAGLAGDLGRRYAETL